MQSTHRPTTDMLALLRGVSRSFYLSIRLLPGPLRRPVAVAYLLARASDTLADTTNLPTAQRKAKLNIWARAIEGEATEPVADLAASVAPLQSDPEERALITVLPECLMWLESLAPADKDDVRAVLRHITRGQALDLERFTDSSAPCALNSADQLNEYTYLVAGCVGEFWTDLCFRHLPNFAVLPQPEMRELGRRYGMALQLVNILRDTGGDLADGRCYFPADQMAAAGLSAHNISSHLERFDAVWSRWEIQAREGLAMGMRYVDAVQSRRVRAASALPALLGARTLALLRLNGPERVKQKVKVPRAEVHGVMRRLAFTFAARTSLRAMFSQLSDARVTQTS